MQKFTIVLSLLWGEEVGGGEQVLLKLSGESTRVCRTRYTVRIV